MLVFDARNLISFKKFNAFITEKTKIFQSGRAQIFKKYGFFDKIPWNDDVEKYQQFRNEYRNLIQTIITDCINYYRPYLPNNLFISEFGSFVKRTERIYSDIDFTICYDIKKTDEYECAEEMLDYTIAKIFGYSIDHVHGNFQHYPKHPEFENLPEKENLYCILFKDNSITYSCGQETLSENMTNIKNSRDYKTLLTSFKLKYKKKADIDSLYSIEILENNTEHNFLADLEKLEEKNNICDGYCFNFEKSILPENFSISDIKKILKHSGIVEFYIFLAKLRKILSISKTYSMNIEDIWNNENIINFFGKDYLLLLRKCFIKFLFYWNRIEHSLISRGIPLSTRCHKHYSATELNSLLINDWGEGTTIQTVIDSKNDLMKIVEIGVKRLADE